MVFIVFSKLGSLHHNLILEQFYHPKKNTEPIKQPLPVLPPPALGNRQTAFSLYGLFCSGPLPGVISESLWSFVICQRCVKVPTFPHPHERLPGFLNIMAVLVGSKWYVTLLICISLMTNEVEHLFMFLSAICISSLEKCLFKAFAQFLIQLFSPY